MKQLKNIFLVLLATVLLNACSPSEGNFPGSEYMPDMAHSIANETNVYSYYHYNTWDEASTFKLKELSNPRLPVAGTVPRGYTGVHFADAGERTGVMEVLSGANAVNAKGVPPNGHVPYYYQDTEEERQRAIAEIIDNPFPITDAGLARGKELYNVFCGICHGEKGDGVGYLVADDNPNAVYPAAPANFLLDEFVAASNGRYYHSIMYGKNVMGAYADKINYEERWQVIHYIRSLQAKEKKLEYNENANTFNPEFGVPAAQLSQLADNQPMEMTGNEPLSSGEEEAVQGDHQSDH